MIGILGGTFDPPHNGHVALARAALEKLPIERLLVLVAARPGHRRVVADVDARLRLARSAFCDTPAEVELDENAFTV
ncbi:MAG TPA: adenylyltransferase/cytidyltransferase family protein, partial [Gaiellaceae bacterium]|nr:adenylyltransferase/cytidyltransferase family protein [Gaiellaceae bacterium]